MCPPRMEPFRGMGEGKGDGGDGGWGSGGKRIMGIEKKNIPSHAPKTNNPWVATKNETNFCVLKVGCKDF